VAEGTGGVFSLGLFEGVGGGGGEEGNDGEKSRGLTSLPALIPSSNSPPSSASSSSTLVAFVTARLQDASQVDMTDARYLGLLEEGEEAEREAAARAAEGARAEAAEATTAEAATATEATTTATTPRPPPPPQGPGANLLGPPPANPAAVYILTLGVCSERHRGRGIAKELVGAVVEKAAAAAAAAIRRPCSSLSLSPSPSPLPRPEAPDPVVVYLHVAAFNARAVSLYASCGFQRLATFSDFYSISTERRPERDRTLYDAQLFAMRVFSSSSSPSSLDGEGGRAFGASWPFPLPPPAPLPPPPPVPALLPPAAAAVAGVLLWLTSLASSLLARVSLRASKGEEEEDEDKTRTAGKKKAAPWLSRLFRRRRQ